MIIKGKSHNNAIAGGDYLAALRENDRAELIEARGTAAQDIKGACQEMAVLAAWSNAEKPFYHASINPAIGEHLTPEQWEFAVELLEKKLGLEDHQRVIVEHEKEGRAHRHIFWNRVDPETLTAKRMSWNYVQHEQTAREIENAFNLEKVQGVHVNQNGEKLEKGDERRAEYGPTHDEVKQSKKTGVNLYKWRKELRAIAAGAEGKSGAELIAALEAKGHMVAAGDKVAFVILDPSGKAHRMAQQLKLSPDELKERLKGVELSRVIEAQERQAAQQFSAHQKETPPQWNVLKGPRRVNPKIETLKAETGKTITAAASGAENGIDFIINLQDKGLQIARNSSGGFSVVTGSGFSFAVTDNKEMLLQVAALEKDGVILPTCEQVQEELKLDREEQRKIKAQRRQEFQEKKELYVSRMGATLYDNGGMASQQKDALHHAADKQNLLKTPRPISPTERQSREQQKREQTQRAFNTTGAALLGNRKEKEQQERPKGDDEKPRERWSQKEELQRDLAPAMHRRDTTEQTDRKQRKSAKDAMKEVFEKDFSKSRAPSSLTHEKDRDGWERERER